MRKLLTRTQKRKNAELYQIIRKGYNNLIETRNDVDLTYIQFKNRVLAMKQATGLSTIKSIKKVYNTEDIVSPAERSRVNLLQALREKFSTEYNKIVSLTRDPKGRFISSEKLRGKLEWS
jgi:hypothetical protein